jgi:hypothetical protein
MNSKNSEKLGQFRELINKYCVKFSELFDVPVKKINS